jgi:hypothetical protein
MKTRILLYFFISSTIALFSCSTGNNTDLPSDVVNNPNTASGKYDAGSLPVITFEKDFHDFGNLRSGEKVSYFFKFKNTGKSLLIISKVSTSCGCTISDYPKQPIKSGESGTVQVSFDSEGRHGIQNKSITVLSNTQPSTTVLHIKANVVESNDR